MRAFQLLGACFLVGLLAACSSLGPQAIQHSRTDYNVVLQRTSDQQLLLNLVRLRYRDRPLFLETNALTTQFKFSPSIRAGVSGGEHMSTSGSVSAEFYYEEKPTVTYTPLQGQDYVQRVMTPISWQTLELLDNVGWRSDRLLRVCVQRVNHLGNAVTASGPTPKKAPEYADFIEMARLYHQLKSQGFLHSYRLKQGDEIVQFLEVRTEAQHLPEYQRFIHLLGMQDEQQGRFKILLNTPVRMPASLQVETRSFAGILYFLSQSVEVPERDIAAGRVTLTRDENGRVFDWGRVTQDLMRIRSSDHEPENAAVKVYYRNSWFYIDDSDLESKSTFVLLGQLFALQSGEIKNTGPVLTLPVNN